MNPIEVSTPALAYLGDCVLELLVRETLVQKGLSTSAHLNKEALSFVRAGAQAEAMKKILPHLTEEEEIAYHRGRNMKTVHVPKNSTVAEYHSATGMETLFGYLHLFGKTERIKTLFQIGYLQEENNHESSAN